MINEKKFPIIERVKVADSTYELRFGIPKGEEFNYLPGQYVVVRVNKKVADSKGPSRSFSISSSPTNKKYISTCFRFRDEISEFKNEIMNCELGTEVFIRGPLGKFTLTESEKNIVLIAGGVGITPFMSMICYLTENKNKQKITLIYTNRGEETRAYSKELKDLEKKNKNLKLVIRDERVTLDCIKEKTDIKESIYYICGTTAMVLSVVEMLKELGVSEDRIKFEKFSGY